MGYVSSMQPNAGRPPRVNSATQIKGALPGYTKKFLCIILIMEFKGYYRLTIG